MSRPAVALMRFATSAPATDVQLLRAFATSRKDDAFSELVRRHGPMVLAACTRVLSDPHDAEDAFQATFLVLARKPGAVRGVNLAGWLYGVAIRTARGVRVTRDRRRKRDLKGAEESGRDQVDPAPALEQALAVTEQAAIIDEELAKLSAPHRDALVLCELRGLSRKQAAAELDIPEGTLSSRLAAAKRKLGERLAARGLAPTAVLAGALAPVPLPAALVQVTAVAVRGAVGGVANAAATAVIKAMLFDRFRTTALTVSVCLACVAGGWAITGAGDAPADNPAPAPRAVDEAVALVSRLGSSDFAERETAEKELRELGLKAENALKAGCRSESPEVRARCVALLNVVRKNALDALVKSFDPKAVAVPEHPLWRRFRAIAGDTPASRDIFFRVINNRHWLQRLDRAEADPKSAAQVYREVCIEIGRQALNPHLRAPYPYWDRIEGTAFLLILGSYPGTTLAGPGNREPDTELASAGESEISGGSLGLNRALRGEQISYGATPEYPNPPDLKPAVPGTDRVFTRLLAAWLPLRTDPDVLAEGFFNARYNGEGEAFLLPFARKYAADWSGAARAKCHALEAIAATGTFADLPLFEAMFDNREICFTVDNPTPGTRPERATVVQYRDAAVALALLLCDQDPLAFGFENATNPWAIDGRKRKVSHYATTLFGFPDDKQRAAAHAKARQFFDERKKRPAPVRGAKFWPRFAKWVGDDTVSRELFELMASEPKNLELLGRMDEVLQKGLSLDAPADILSAPEVLYQTRRDELDTLAAAGKPVSPAAISGWMYLGTYPRTSRPSQEARELKFMPWDDRGPDRGELVRHFTGPGRAAWCRLFGVWAEQHATDDSCRMALAFGLRHDIKETLHAARKVFESSCEQDREKIASALLALGKYGYDNDNYAPAVTARTNAAGLCFGPLYQAHQRNARSGPKGETGVTTRLSDVAFAAMIIRLGGAPEDFGFVWTKTDARKRVPWADQLGSELRSWEAIGFSSEADRAAAHQKARTWLGQKKKWVGEVLEDKREAQQK